LRRFVLAFATLVLLVWAALGIFEVKPEESGVTFVFGRMVNSNVPSGIHWNAPPPIGRQVTMPTRLTQVMHVGYTGSESTSNYMSKPESLWFTGGASIVEGRLDIQYSIDKLDRFLLSHDDPEAYMRLIAERAVTRFFAGLHVDDVLTTRRQTLLQDVSSALQSGLDKYDTGIQVQDVSIVHLAPPSSGGVSDSFRQVQTARSERERQIENARSGAAQIKFEAQAEAESIRSQSQADRFARVERARADGERFLALAREWAAAPDVTRTRLYRDVVPEVLQRAKLYVIPSEAGGVTVEDR
jgi:membrane protease subunit HflK